MSTSVRQPKPTRKGVQPDPSPARRPSAWNGARASPTFSPGAHSARLPTSPGNGAFPPLAVQPNGGTTSPGPGPRTETDRMLASLAGLTGTTITLNTKTGQRWEGVVLSTGAEGDTTGVTLRDARDISVPGAPLKERHFVASTNIDRWSSGPADAQPPVGDTFKTDTDISRKTAGRERELQAWQPDAPPPASGPGSQGDDLTFGTGASSGPQGWDQFAANEKLFGVKAGFDEDLYTTKLDRNAPDFREREREAQRIANEIMGAMSNNPHVQEERVMNTVDDSGVNEEDKYGAVVRGPNAYVPPAARKSGQPSAAKPDTPKVTINAPDGSSATSPPAKMPPAAAAASSSSPAPAANGSVSKPADAVPAFRDFVTNEKQRLAQKRQAMIKNDMDKRMAELVKFSKNFKLNKPIPEDLVPILAKDEEKQKQIKEKSAEDAASAKARTIATASAPGAPAGVTPSPSHQVVPTQAKTPAPSNSAAKNGAAAPQKNGVVSSASAAAVAPVIGAKKPADGAAAPAVKKGMFIQPIPPFKPKNKPAALAATPASGPGASSSASVSVAPSTAGTPPAVPSSPSTAARLNTTPTPPKAPSSPKTSKAEPPQQPNPFFGTRPIKKGPVSIRDDFNPFKYNKVAEASAVAALWPYQGKRYLSMFPPIQQQPPPQQSPHMVHPGPQPLPPPSYEEDSAAQAAARQGYVYAYPPYAYAGQPMMPGMPPPGPPGAYMPSPYMQPMGYPPMHAPNGQPMYAAPMGQMPPPQAYMQPPPPGSYPAPPNGAGHRPSMPPTPIPAHAHAYYQPSPQRTPVAVPVDAHGKTLTTPVFFVPAVQHAVPYHMMMPPPPPGANVPPPHGYEVQQVQAPVQMGGVPGHA
ncbi:hypothetical protein PUNSTDRAFT_47123 [Punctularia strigosozonata HHB-11173 SS5]|uniref:LsmAD domain-containing protein n=1 Tax=Punctularia strigosozonata (strain HHB-11173) TaxID=741275 RepID=R7S5P8_PUNST|nr:uncharacterized protein PUNSTDRAFT_47123 [Punctularia strigosozonata HHB-11173 SS5]EIN04841.1 hypothetical protein PUNSTDRAFT_47123 [Punctularia strigosozonata HHB-11173 SS5]